MNCGFHDNQTVYQISVIIVRLAFTANFIFSSSTIMSDLDSELLCVICHQLYSNDHVPKVLPCKGGHLAGLPCLKDGRKGGIIKCPICVRDNLTTTSPEDLQTNRPILRMALKQSTCAATAVQPKEAG